MKRDWTRPQMRLSPRDVASDLFSFLPFLRLALVIFLCFPSPLLVTKKFGPAIGTVACILAFPLWWYHFGWPRSKEQRSGLFSQSFCMWGYFVMGASLIVAVLEYFGVIQEGRPIPFVRQLSPYLRVAIIVGFVTFWFYEFSKRKKPSDGA